MRREDFSINTIVGPGTSVAGNIEAEGFTRVDGEIRGDLEVRGRVVIGEKARMRSNVSGTFVTIGGVVYGNILARERLIVLGSGLVLGDVITRRIQADDGCLIHGKVKVCRTEEAWDEAVAEYRDETGLRDALAFRDSQGKSPPTLPSPHNHGHG